MSEGWRAALSVPLIALVNGLIVGSFAAADVVTSPAGSQLLDAGSAFALNAIYAGVLSLAAGLVVAPAAWLLARWLPEPRFAYLLGAGVVICLALGLVLASTEPVLIVTMVLLGAVDAWLWWRLVERHRTYAPAMESAA